MDSRTQASFERYKKAKDQIAGGVPIVRAIKASGLSTSNYYKFEKQPLKEKRAKSVLAPAIVGPRPSPFIHEPKSSVAVILCTPGQLPGVLKNLGVM